MDSRMYSLEQAADVSDTAVDVLRKAVRDRVVAVTASASPGEVLIPADELARYVGQTRHADPFGHQRKHKILILGEDLLFAGTLKLELQRDPRMDVRYASWGLDALLMVNHYGADLFVVDLTPSQAVPEPVFEAVCRQRASARGAAVAYYTPADEALGEHPIVRSRLSSLCPEAAVSKTKGLRALAMASLRSLGLDHSSRIFRLHG
jgi:hypothetical protein